MWPDWVCQAEETTYPPSDRQRLVRFALRSIASSTLRNHRRKLRLEGIARHLDHLCEQCDSLAPGHPDRLRLIGQIEHWNVEYLAED